MSQQNSGPPESSGVWGTVLAVGLLSVVVVFGLCAGFCATQF